MFKKLITLSLLFSALSSFAMNYQTDLQYFSLSPKEQAEKELREFTARGQHYQKQVSIFRDQLTNPEINQGEKDEIQKKIEFYEKAVKMSEVAIENIESFLKDESNTTYQQLDQKTRDLLIELYLDKPLSLIS